MASPDDGLWVLATTLPDRAAAAAVARALVTEGLAACAQVGADLLSFYRWEGAVRGDPEVALVLKVTGARYAACAARLRQLHPYTVPQVVGWRAERVDPDYARWARDAGEGA
jgi:periplasmic divalent cation tolerance protein